MIKQCSMFAPPTLLASLVCALSCNAAFIFQYIPEIHYILCIMIPNTAIDTALCRYLILLLIFDTGSDTGYLVSFTRYNDT